MLEGKTITYRLYFIVSLEVYLLIIRKCVSVCVHTVVLVMLINASCQQCVCVLGGGGGIYVVPTVWVVPTVLRRVCGQSRSRASVPPVSVYL